MRNLEVTVGKLVLKNVDYYASIDSSNFREKFRKDWCEENSAKVRSCADGSVVQLFRMSPAKFMKGYNSLTDIQLVFVRRIIGQCESSKSYRDLIFRLVDINKDVCMQVPKIEQERLLIIIAVFILWSAKNI